MANIFAGLEKNNNVNGQTGNTANIFAGLEKQETPYERYRRQYNLNNNAGSSDDEPGFFSGFKSGVAGVFGGQARFGEVNSPFGGDTLGEAADYFEGIAKDNARTKFTEGPELSLDYITDPQGLRYDVGNTVGSGAALGLETAAAAAAVAHSPFAAGAAAVGRAVPALAKLWNSPLGKVVVGNVAQTPLEAISEGGNLVPELRQAGYSEDEIQEIANRAAALNIGGLGLSNLIQSYGASKVLGLLKNGAGKMTAAEIAKRGALGVAGGGASNYFEEGMQNAIGDIAMGRPIDWQEAELQARTGGVTGAVLGGLGGTGGAYMQSRRAQNVEQAESEQPAAGANLINRVRALEGQIPYEAPDGTNCMRTLGLALAGTPYENQINVDQAIATATANGQLMNPAEYTPQPGDLAVVNNGNHIVMVTENGGTIQNGASHNGVYESEQSPADMFGGVQYYIRTSDYNNGRAGVGRRDLRSMYADDTDQAIADMNNTPAIRLPEQRQDIDFSGRGEVEDNSALNSFNEADARRAMARNEAADYAELTGEETDNVQQWNTPQQRTLRMPRRTGGVTYNPVTAMETPYLDRLNRQAVNRRADDLAMENQRVMQETAGRRQRFTGQGTPTFQALMQRTLAARSQRQQNLNNALRSNNLANLTARAMSGDHGARQTFDKLRPEVRSVLLNRAIDRLNVQNMDEQADEARKALKLAQEQQETKERAQREADKRELLQGAEEYLRSSYDSPAEGARAELRDAKAGINSLLQPIIDQLREGMGNGVTLAPGREDGRMVRISNNAPWYQDWHKEHKRKPTQKELEDIARDVYTGRNSYGLPGWEVNQENEAEFAQNRATLQEMDDFVDAYEQLEQKFMAEPNGGRKNGTSEESNAGEVAARGQAETEQTDNQNAEAESEVSKKAKEVVANLQAEDVDRIAKKTADKKGDKKAALREFKKRVSGADEVLYIWEGLTGRSRPSADQQASQSNAELHLSGDNIIPQSEAENKTAPNTVGNAQDGARQAETGRQEQTHVRARKLAKKPKAEAKFTAKGEKLIPQTAELRGNEITVISKPAKNAANSERLIGVELPEGEYTITVDEWKKAENGRLGNANYNWAKLVQRKYAEAFPNTGVKADTPFIAGNDPFHIRIIDNQITAIKQAVKAYDEKVSADTASAANDTQLSPQVSKRINGWAEQFGLDAGMLRSLIAAKPTESNINEFGRFSALKATADKQKVKAFFDNLHNDNLPMRRVSALFDSQLRQLIFALADRPTGTQQIKAAAVQPQAAQASRFDGNRAESALDKLIGRKQPKQQEQQTGKKFMNVFDESELEAEIAKAKAEMSKLSANPFFNPALMKSLFKIGGIYMQRGVNNFADWSARMVETLGNKVRPFLKSAWDALQAYPADVKFNDDIMTATLEFVGSRVDNGRSRDEIRNEFRTMYGDEYVAYVDAAYEGVNSYPTEIAENADVVNETETQTETEQPQAEAAQEPAANQSESAQQAENTADETTYGMNGALSIEFNPQSNVLSVKIDRDKLTPNSYSIIHDQITHLGFRWSDASKKWRARVNSNANEYDPVRNWARSQGFVFENVSADNQENLPQTQQNANVPQARFNLNEAQNGIEIKFLEKPSQEVLTGLKNAGFRWSGFKKHWYSKQNPRAMAFAESIGYVPENMVQSNQEVNEAPPAPATEPAVQQPAAQEQEATANGNDNDADGYRAVPENVPAAEVQGTESERTTERVREPEVEGRGVQVTGDNGRAAGERPVSGERRPAGESAAQSGTGSNSEGTSERGSVRSLRPAQKKKAKASEVPGHNFTITADENIGKGGAKTKYKDNVAAIKLLKQLEAEDRLATPEEQKVLARYVGWGGLAPVFSYGRDSAWESEKAEIIELLTDEEYSAARGSTNNAHYTSPEVIKGVWDIIERLGFKGGKVLEPSMGIGNFFGMMPEKLRSKSSLNGVELDSLTGRIAKQLYQKASVEITGYEQTKYPDNYFDLAISNVPFGQFSLHDPKYNKFKFNIHNYFFAKAIDQVRPGGLVAFITSTGTMQSGSDAKRLRELLKNKADFIGAVRLPNTAFKENAGTEVTTDLIILQKREPGAAPGKNNHAWLETKDSELTGKYTQQPLQINEYYSEHPEMLIGKLSEDTLYGGGRLALDGTGLDVGKELESRVEKFPKNIYKPRSTNRNTNSLESAHKFLAPSGVRDGEFVLTENGVFANNKGEMTELPKAAQTRAKDYVGLREVTKKILDGQINPNVTDETLDGWRKDLNKVYDKFVAKYGYLNSPKNKRDLAQDPDFGIVSAIEKYTLDKKTKKESAAKADIFTKRTVNPIIKIDKADNPSDALALSLNNTGAVDIDYMADLTGQKPADVVKALKGFIYKDPATNTYVTAEEYLSGNVREKLEIAEFWGKTDPEAAANIEALKKVQPVDLTPEEISVNLGTPWIPESDLRDFAQEMLGMPNWEQPLDIRFNKPAGTWLVAWNKGWRADEAKRSTEATQKWGTARRNFANLLDDALNQRSPVVRDTDIDGKTTVNDAATQAAQEKLKEIKEEFAKWIWKDKDRAERLTAYYNRNFNNMRLREYNGSMLTLPGYSSVAPPLKKHQKDAVWRIIQDGTALLAHTVGAGKTWTMQTAAMELKRLGIVNKSMFVIPNHMLQQFENEFRIIYPNAKLLTISSENLPDVPPPAKKGDTAEAKKRRAAKIAERQKILSRIATEDWDGIIISHNMFKRIPMSPEAYNAFYQEQIDNMRTAILELTGENDRNSNRLVKELEKKAKSLEEKLKRDMNEENKDIVIPFEQLGVDEIFVDEADLFKNLFFVTKMNRIGGLSNTNSQRSLDMYMKTQYLAKHNNGRGIVFATGTPISNTMAEMFTMLRYLDGKGLKENDLDFFDNWAAQFTERETVFERSPDGQGYRRVEKFTKFKNMPELVKMFRKVADVKTKDDLNLKIPKLKNGKPTIVEIEPNEALTDYIKNTAKERAQAIHDRSVDPTEDNMLKLTGDLRKASLDMRLIDPTVPASVAGGKLRAVAENVYKKYKESDSTKGAQLVFCDLSTPKGTSDKVVETDGAIAPEAAEDGENVTAYEEIKKMLVKQGVPAEEVAFIHDAKTKEQKEELFAKVRDGRVRVLIGSTEKMGAGTNVQQKLVALHHVDAPWRPRDIEQREGRILRQGNENAEVEIFNYVTKDSFDANMWEKLKNKATMIAQALSNNLTGRTLEDADATVLSFAEIESLASGNPLIMEKVSTEADLNKYQSLYGTYLKNQAENENRANTLPATIEYNKTIADNARTDIKNRSSIEGDKFSITLGKKVFNKRADAKEALEAYASNKSSSAVRTIGKIGGFELRLRPIAAVNSAAAQDSGVQAELVGKNTYTCDATLGSIEHAVMHAPERTLERAQRNIETSEKELKAVQKEMAEPFKYREELEAAQKRLAEIDAELGITDAAGNTQYSATTEPAAQRSSEEVLHELQDALPNGKFEDAGNGEYTVTLPNNARIKVNIADRMVVNNREAARARGAHGLMRGGELNIEGSWQSFKGSDVDGLLNLSRTGRAGTAYHEVMHAAMDLALTEKEQQAMVKHFNKEAQATGKTVSEAISDGYVEWKRARAQRRGTLFGKLYNKMQDMLNTLKSLFTGVENAHNVMRRVESGEVWQRSRGTLYSGDSAPKFNVSSNKISQFVNVALKNADKNLRLLLGKVSNGEAKAIKDSTGYDVSGFTHVWLSEDVRHIQNRHGVKTEKVKGQIGLSEADMVEALEAIKSPNRIEKGSPTSNGEPSIRFIKQTGTGEYTVVEVVRQKNKRLAVKTMWKTASENTKEAATATLRADNSPQYTSETDSGETASMRKNNNKSSSFNQNISQQSPEVNGNDVQYSAEELTPEQKAAQAFTNTERKTTWQSAKDWVKKQRTEFYRDWIDKNDSLHGLDEAIEMTTGIKTDGDQSVYNRVQTLPATAAGMANALIEGDSNSLKALNERLKNKKLPHNVTMQMVLENINREKMDKSHPNYLKRGGFKNWIDAFGAYLGSIRLNEMLLLHDEAYQQRVKEWEANGSKGKKPEYKPYLLPKGLTQDDLESVIKNAPPEFKKAAQMYWQFNDNILTVMEDAGLISGETHKLLNTKYKYYCPLMRDFSDTAAADNFINGLSNGGRGIGNVSSMLRRISIEGSERNVINPLESTVKAVAVMCNRAERNKVGQMAVELAQKGGLDAVIQEAEGTVADPKNCIFTVMFDGKKQAYKTTQELYGPIVGYNLPAAGFVLGVARNAARLLRAGATTSPSFIIRNLIRDTVFAGVSSKNGFIPIVDTIRGAYALAHDPRLRAEFKVAGVTQFNFYSSSEQIVKSLDEMAGGKAWKDYGAADIWRALMKYPAFASEFIESSTRMGEFMKARKKGASLEEAAQAARELTLDFSRSGVQGEKVNQIVPFFNAVLQGGDKMVRLIKQDPVGTGTKLAMYIVLPSLALWALNHDEDWYKEIDPEVKATCWLLPGGLRIPKPQEAGILFGSGIEAVLDQAFNKDPEAIGNWAKVFGGNMAPSIMPTIFLPLLEWQANYSFFRGQSITPQRLQNLPDELQYTPNTSALARTVGGVLKLSPVKIDNTIRGYTGTMGMTLVQQLDWFADEKQNMPYKKVSEWPFLRDFTVNQNIQNRSVDDFYKMLNKANEQHAGYGKKGKPTPAVQGVRKAGQLISKAQKDIRELTVNPRLSPEAKRQRIDQRKAYIKNVAEKANMRFRRFFDD
jgi:N12 class adenine-specific DNA methylase